jgi:hypothetical protein
MEREQRPRIRIGANRPEEPGELGSRLVVRALKRAIDVVEVGCGEKALPRPCVT